MKKIKALSIILIFVLLSQVVFSGFILASDTAIEEAVVEENGQTSEVMPEDVDEGQNESTETESIKSGAEDDSGSDATEAKTNEDTTSPGEPKATENDDATSPSESKATKNEDENEEILVQESTVSSKSEESAGIIMPMAISTPGVYTTDPNSIVVPTAIVGVSTNAHTLADYLWANGDTVYVAIKATHELQHMTLNDVQNYDSDVYNANVAISIDGESHLPTGLSGNTKDSHWTVFKFRLADLQLPEGDSPFVVKGIGGGHDVDGFLEFTIPKEPKTVNKTWLGGTNHPAVELQLIAENVDGETLVLRKATVNGTESSAWTYTFLDVPMYDPYGRPYTFSADETEVPVNYDKTIDGMTVTNTYNPDQISIEVTKVWIGPAADSVTIKLFANDVDTGKTLILNQGNNWEGSFTDLNKSTDVTGDLIIYTVEEVAIDGYTTNQTGSVEDGFTFTNTNDTEISVDVEKKWIGPAADSVTIKLFADGEDTGQTVELTEGNWSDSFTNLRKYDETTGEEIEYTVVEVAIPSYTGITTGTVEAGFIITNTNDATIDVAVEKEWIGSIVGPVSIKLLADGIETDKTLILNSDNDWQGSFENLRKYDALTGNEIIYTVVEAVVPAGYEVSYSTSEDGTFIVTNTEMFGSLTVEKVDENGEPLAGAIFELFDSNGSQVGNAQTSGVDGKIVFEDLVQGDYTLRETKAPNGYNKLTQEINITIAPGEGNLHITKEVKNTPIGWEIPNTGGMGTLGFYGVGIILMGVAGWFFLRRRRA